MGFLSGLKSSKTCSQPAPDPTMRAYYENRVDIKNKEPKNVQVEPICILIEPNLKKIFELSRDEPKKFSLIFTNFSNVTFQIDIVNVCNGKYTINNLLGVHQIQIRICPDPDQDPAGSSVSGSGFIITALFHSRKWRMTLQNCIWKLNNWVISVQYS